MHLVKGHLLPEFSGSSNPKRGKIQTNLKIGHLYISRNESLVNGQTGNHIIE
jgi:hypothetical protein